MSNKLYYFWGLYVLILGILLYLALSLSSAFFIHAVPMDEDWCIQGFEVQTSEDESHFECVIFKNELEESKYEHNLKMKNMNTVLLFVFVLVGGLFNWLAIKKSPLSKAPDVVKNMSIYVVFGAIASGLFIPFTLSIVLPPPTDWMPFKITQIHEDRVQDILTKIEEDL